MYIPNDNNHTSVMYIPNDNNHTSVMYIPNDNNHTSILVLNQLIIQLRFNVFYIQCKI